MRRYVLCLLLTLAAAGSGRAAEYAAVRYLPDKAPAAYIQASEDVICIAPSLEKLAAAPIVRADPAKTVHWKQTDGKGTNYTFPEVELPSPSGLTVRAEISMQRVSVVSTQRQRGRQFARLTMQGTLSTRDGAGAVWSYSFFTRGGGELTADPKAAPSINLPDPRDSKLAVETVIQENKARIGARLTLAGTWVSALKKGGAKASARMEVVNAAGKVVHVQEGDLEKFGFT